MGQKTLTLQKPLLPNTLRAPECASRLFRISVVLLLGLVCACASTPPAPDWVNDSPDRYPAERFFRGISSDKNPEAAAQLALESVSQQTQGEAGAEIVETWFDEENELHWAIAVLERQPLFARLASERARLDEEIAAAVLAGQSDAPEQALPLLAKAAALIPARDQLIERIAFLGGAANPSEGSIEAQNRALSDTLREVKKALRIEVTAFETDGRTGEPGLPLERNRRALMQKVVGQGFTPGSSDEGWGMDPVWLRVRSTVALERLELRPNDTLVSVQWDAAVEITDMAVGGDIVAVLAEEGRAVHSTEAEARRQAAAAAREFAASAFEVWLIKATTQAEPNL